ncbi:TfoX/Sxy family protein [Aquabacterium sp. J223]|uniref:TfoX/Sxy family protein n=1 Tax=Aquabacterium sp. J223 TaxID=2898431 RepID=UPI0021AE2F6A|nr:TfoX/Sxy family protein [Aquabacterium sp. J223]UUX96473.1 TfoX/Sxy family protein [Aquabacterium sp. J223]
MAAPPFVEHCIELMSTAGAVRAKRMFSGHGLYLDGVFVALIVGEVLYLRTTDTTRPAFEAAGCRPFAFTKAGRTMETSYWSAPAEALESPPALQPWLAMALQAALAARSATPVRRPRSAARRAAGAGATTPARGKRS